MRIIWKNPKTQHVGRCGDSERARRPVTAARLGRDTRTVRGASGASVGRVRGLFGTRPALGAFSRVRLARSAGTVDQPVQDAPESGQRARLVPLPGADFVEVRAVRPADERVPGLRFLSGGTRAVAVRGVFGVFLVPVRVRHFLLPGAFHRAQVRTPLKHVLLIKL